MNTASRDRLPPRWPGRYTPAFFCAVAGVLVVVLGGLVAAPASAQLMVFDEIPWQTPADSTSCLAMILQLDHRIDDKYDWRINRLLLTGLLPAGEQGAYFLRLPVASFDAGTTPLLQRWPWLRGENADLPADWPQESQVFEIAQPEIGVTGPVALPGLGPCHYGVALGLPVGNDRLYPVASKSLPLRLELRRLLPVSPLGRLAVTAGYLLHMDSAGDDLDATAAFPSGYHLGLAWRHALGMRGHWSLVWDGHQRDGRRLQQVGARIAVPWRDVGTWGLQVSREIQGSLDRSAAWLVSLTWRFDSRPDGE